jgi:predicted CXXCH cytochrome family protein
MNASVKVAIVACLWLLGNPAPAQDFVGSAACVSCHERAYDDWQQSHHRHAMAPATGETVLGDFEDATFDYFGHRSRFYRRAGRYFVETDNAEGNPEEFEIAYTLGFYPLQQYLVEFPDGRFQTLSVSWDSRPKEDGGQRWYHLYPDEEIEPGDALHWTGAFQNWNSRCASCHTTDLKKNYTRERDAYATRWAEADVGCEACHGPASQHLAWARGDATIRDQGFRVRLDKVWDPSTSRKPAALPSTPVLGTQLGVCAGCHSRREELQQRDVTHGFFDDYSLTPLLDGLYYADGQMREEVYVTGSFLQSKMHGNQVSCTNCHEPHTNRLRLAGNALCLQCHEAQTFQTEKHLFHAADSAGAQCVSCHMPVRTYMGVDRRRDHSFRVPDAIASVTLGVPNACTQCHTDRSDRWAADFLSNRTARAVPYYRHTAALAAARRNDASALLPLLAIAEDASEPAILRSIALLESARFPAARQVAAAAGALASPEPLVRAGAASALSVLAPPQRLQYLQPLLGDPVKSVRMAVARELVDLAAVPLPTDLRTQVDGLLSELEAALVYNADMPEAMTELGLLYAARRDLVRAEQAFAQARKLSPRYLAAMLNLADLYRAEGRDDLGAPLLEEALAAYPESADANHALGLLYVRIGRTPDSVELFGRARELAPANARYALVYAVALAEVGRTEQGIAVLEDAVERFPDDAEIRDALDAYRANAASNAR